MSLTPTIYASSDAGAPALTGQAGSLAALLDAVLVNGYGSGGSAKAPLGWTLAYMDTNLRSYRLNGTSGSGYYLRIDDTTTRTVRLRGYATMSDINTGNGPTPTETQRPNGSLWVKSTATDSTVRPWWIIGNERCFYLFIATDSIFPGIYTPNFAGDIFSLKAGDVHNFFLTSTEATSVTNYSHTHTNFLSSAQELASSVSSDTTYAPGHIGRGYTGTGSALGLMHLHNATRWSPISTANIAYPNPITNGMLWDRLWMSEGAFLLRGYMPGVIVPFHKQPFADFQVVTDLPDFPVGTSLVSKWLCAVAPGYTGSYDGSLLFELGEWN